MEKMNSEVKEKWLAALRSGGYEQGAHRLRTKNRFCCLGVLCDIYRKEIGDGEWKEEEGRLALDDTEFKPFEFVRGEVVSNSVLDEKVMEWAGLKMTNPHIRSREKEGKPYSLAAMNDNGLSFEEIANHIESDL